MSGNDIDKLRHNISSIHLNRGSDLTFVHHEHFLVEFGSVSEFRDRLALLNQRSLFDLRIELGGDRIEILIVYKLNGDLLRQVACLLLGLSCLHNRADGFLQFFKWPFARLLFCVDLDDVNPELRLNQITDCTPVPKLRGPAL